MNAALRLRSNADFQRIFREGRSLGNRYAAVYVLAHKGPSRFGIAVSRRLGGAVLRNRVRRRVREVIRLAGHVLGPGWDVVIVARQGAVVAPFTELSQAIMSLLQRAGVATQPE